MTPTEDFDSGNPFLTPDCGQTVARLQFVLDGELPATALDHDPHAVACPQCRERIATARVVLANLPLPADPPDAQLTRQILAAVSANAERDRGERSRRRVFALAGGLAIAASLWLGIWLIGQRDANPPRIQAPEIVNAAPTPEISVAPEPHPAPDRRPVRLEDEFTKAEHALLGSSKPITEPATFAPMVLVKLTNVLTEPSPPPHETETTMSLSELPDAARAGLLPVTTTTQKAFSRLLNDVGSIQVSGPN